MPFNRLILCRPLPAINLSWHQGLFQWVSFLPQVTKYWTLRFSISSSSEYSGFISFRIERFDLLSVQGTLKSLFQHHSLKASILWDSAFFMIQLSYLCMATGKSIDLTIGTSGSKVTSLLFNMLSSLAIAFLPRNKHLLISWLQSHSSVILGPKKMKFVSFQFPSFYLPGSII